MATLSGRSRRIDGAAPWPASDVNNLRAPPAPQPASRGKSLLLVVTAMLLASCAYLLTAWEPKDFDNIGHVRARDFLSYGPIDVVYTWVNGTDPRWKAEKEFWHKHWIASLTGQPLPTRDEEDAQQAEIKGKDDSNSDNRFRDNEELRYSLRSIEKYAPWIRHVYIVTDGQVPSWLNLAAPNLHIVKHSEIFRNQSHLPVFASPAIEWNLDNIPGLSDNFLYLNDDVFFGSHVHPEDFVSPRGVQKVYFAWEVPHCAPGCWDDLLHNGQCDLQCNTTMCDFDMGDCGCDVNPVDGRLTCDPLRVASIQEATSTGIFQEPTIAPDYVCDRDCHYSWLGDSSCDLACDYATCGYDAGDCGAEKLQLLPGATIMANHTLIRVPRDVNATFLNFSMIFGAGGFIDSASHDNSELIRSSSLIESNLSLVVIFGRDTQGQSATSSALVSVIGRDAEQHQVQLDFAIVRGDISITADADATKHSVVLEHGNSSGIGFATFQNASLVIERVHLPFAFGNATWQMIEPIKQVESPNAASSAPQASTDDQPDDVKTKIEVEQETKLEVFIPFDKAGEHVQSGDVVELAMAVRLRLHNDQGDDDQTWFDLQSCRLSVPEFPEVVVDDAEDSIAAATTTTDEDVSKSPAAADEVVEVSVEANAAAETIAPSQGDAAAAPASLTTTEDPIVPALPPCKLVDGGILVLFRVPTTFQNIHNSLESGDLDVDHGEAVGETVEGIEIVPTIEIPVGSDSEAPSEAAPPVRAAAEPQRPQLLDGHICVFNMQEITRTYCFAIAMGRFYDQRVLVRLPPSPEEQQPDPDDDPTSSWLELRDFCVDHSLQRIRLQPRRCALDEVPMPDPDTAQAAEETPEQKRLADQVEARRLACEAQRKRMATQDPHAFAADPPRGVISRLFRTILSPITRLLHSDTLESTRDDLEDAEYDDVCSPLDPEAEADADGTVDPPTPEISEENAQALLSTDTFGDSLRYVNMLYTRAFGKYAGPDRRRVPSHMPFLLNRQIIREIKTRWPAQIEATSAHRFRHPQDMQFSFSYFHYVLNRHLAQPPTLAQVWREYLDVNHNGVLDENEVLTVASLAHGSIPPSEFVDRVRECLKPPKREKVREHATAEGVVRVVETLTPSATMETLETACPDIAEQVLKHVRHEPQFELMTEDEVTFHMLSEQYSFAWGQMLGTRARRTKFVCINDDMKYPSPSVSQILHELFLSIWPKRSQFELPYHLRNRYDHIDAYRAAQKQRRLYLYIAVGVAAIVIAIFWSDLKRVFGFQDLARARAASASQLGAEVLRQQADAMDKDE